MESKKNQEEEEYTNTVESYLNTWITHDLFTWQILPSFSADMESLHLQKLLHMSSGMHTHKHTLNKPIVPRLIYWALSG